MSLVANALALVLVLPNEPVTDSPDSPDSPHSQAGSIPPARLAALRARVEESLKLTRVPGLCLVGVKDGEIVLRESFGRRRPDSDAKVDADTRFYIASVTKTFVATAMMTLVADGKVALADPVKKYLPGFDLVDHGAAATITLEDLLSHRPGLQCEPVVFRDAYSGQIDDATYFDLLAMTRPGSAPSYSNIHFTLLGRVLEAVEKTPNAAPAWRDVLAQRLFAPLGMTRTTGYASVLWGDENSAVPTNGAGDGSVILPHKSDRTMHAAGGLGTTGNDAAKWLLFHLGHSNAVPPVLSKDQLASMRVLRTKAPDPIPLDFVSLDGFGLGWNIGTYRGFPICAHGGNYAGSAAFFVFLPSQDIGAAVLLNRDSTSTMALAFVDALDLLLGRDLDPQMIEMSRSTGAGARWPSLAGAPKDPCATPGGLTLDRSKYVGSYRDDRFGTVEVSLDGPRLRVTLGDYDFVLDSTGADRFDACYGPLERVAGSFELSDDGKSVEYVSLAISGTSPILFERQ